MAGSDRFTRMRGTRVTGVIGVREEGRKAKGSSQDARIAGEMYGIKGKARDQEGNSKTWENKRCNRYCKILVGGTGDVTDWANGLRLNG